MTKYSKKTQEMVEKTMRKKKEGKLYSSSGEKVTSNKQAVAIALSESREKEYKVPAQGDGKDGKDEKKKSQHHKKKENSD